MQPIPTRAKIARAWLEHAHSFDRCVESLRALTRWPKSPRTLGTRLGKWSRLSQSLSGRSPAGQKARGLWVRD